MQKVVIKWVGGGVLVHSLSFSREMGHCVEKSQLLYNVQWCIIVKFDDKLTTLTHVKCISGLRKGGGPGLMPHLRP